MAWAFLKTGELPHHDHGHVDGLEDEVPPVDFDPYGMEDTLHTQDMKHTMVGERRSGDERRHESKPVADEHRGGERRQSGKNEGGQQ